MAPGKSKPDAAESSDDPAPPDGDQTPPEDLQGLQKIFTCLFKKFKVDFSHYRYSTIIRRLSRRMALSKKNNYSDYLDYLENNPAEIELLYDDLLLSVTRFFRDPPVFDTLREKIFPLLTRNRSVKNPVRIWVPGCSTGQEVYSLAICLHEYLEETRTKVPIQFFGTDLVQRHIIKARTGLYPDKIREEISPERLERFFDKTSQGLKVIKHIREMCVFAIQDIIHDPPFPNIDLVSCRNVLIYFDADFQETVIPLFYFSLKPSGFLLLGSSETMGKFPQYFNVVDPKTNLFSKRMSGIKPAFRFPIQPTISKLKGMAGSVPAGDSHQPGVITINQQITDVLFNIYTPPGVLVDSNMQIQQFIGRTFPFLEPGSGQASLKLTRMTGEGLMPDIYVAIKEARKKNSPVKKRNIRFKQQDSIITTDICVIPVQDPDSQETSFLIMFEPSGPPPAQHTSGNPPDRQTKTPDDALEDIRQELDLTKQHLQSIIEEKDDVNQDLWAANEEIQSTNEELQSVNEEMEAAKEELESSNEELISLNEELFAKNLELRTAKEFAENLVETASTMIITLDCDACITTFNQYAEKLTGYNKDEVLGRNWFECFIPESDRKNIPAVFEDALKNIPDASQYENSIVIKDGSRRLIRWRNNILTNNLGNTSGVLSIGTDITEYRQIESQLRQATKMEAVGQLAGGIAHDFNNILHMIIGNTELILDDVPKTSPIHANLEEIRTAGMRAAGIVQQLLNFSRKTSHKLIPIDAATVIRDSLKFLRSTIPTTIDMRAEINIRDIAILADPIQINQVFMNICANAFQAMEKTGGALTIRVEEIKTRGEMTGKIPDLSAGDYVRIIIQDTGPGIDPDIINRIFDPYFTTKDFGKGSGMGLAVVQGIVKTHKGAITVESRPGIGTGFTLFFPVSDTKPAIEIKPVEKLPRGNESILFIDDESSITTMAQKMLTRLGYQVEPSLIPQQALETFRQQPGRFDLVITDMTMPQITGVTLSEMLKTIRPDIPIIICTGHSSLIDKEKALQLGIAAYLMKPVSMRDMAKTIRTVLDARS